MKNKLIRDSIHGYIEINEIIVKEIIDTPVFQRLRRIEQTSMRSLYPSAHHDRFVHSIGVYHLGKMALRGLINNIKNKDLYKDYKSFWQKYGICFELACLLHDCGHAPMSHSFEFGYLNPMDKEDCKKKKELFIEAMTNQPSSSEPVSDSVKELSIKDLKEYFKKPDDISPHEMMSAILISRYFRDNIKNILNSIFDDMISDSELSEYIIFMQRAIIGLEYSIDENNSEQDIQNSFKNCLISLLNGNFFDVDKLDYIVRDSIESGANNLSIDTPRILSALTLVEVHMFDKETEVNNLDLNNSVYFEGSESKFYDKGENNQCECRLNMSGVRFKGKLEGKLEIKGSNNYLKTEGLEAKIDKGSKEFYTLTEVAAEINGTCKMMGRYNGQIEVINNSKSGSIDGLVNARISGKIKGKIIGRINNSDKGKTIYELGYLKNALSVIEDTLIARNRLYLWIYAHHKVAYTDYILRNGILRSLVEEDGKNIGELEKNEKSKMILSDMMNIENLFLNKESKNYLLDDGDLIHNMKVNFTKYNNRFAEEWLNRTHMHAVWKSYVEYNNFFSNLSSEQRKKLWLILFNSDANQKDIEKETEANTYEYDNSILKKSSQDYGECTWIKPTGFKLKEMDVSNIHIVLSDESVKRLKDVISKAKVSEEYVEESFFYLYTSKDLKPSEKLQLITFLKSEAKK